MLVDADLDRPAVQRVRADEGQGAGAVDPAPWPSGRGSRASRVFEVDKSVDTKAVNAYVTGVLGTKRIVLWDTLLAKLDDARSARRDGPRDGPLRARPRASGRSCCSVARHPGRPLPGRPRRAGWLIAPLSGPARLRPTLATSPRCPCCSCCSSWPSCCLSPVVLAYSRYQEHEADRFAPRADPRQPLGRHGLRQAPAGEPRAIPRPGLLYKLFRCDPPEHRRADRLLQRLSPLDGGPARCRYGALFRSTAEPAAPDDPSLGARRGAQPSLASSECAEERLVMSHCRISRCRSRRDAAIRPRALRVTGSASESHNGVALACTDRRPSSDGRVGDTR